MTLEAKAYYGLNNSRVLATKMADGMFEVISLASMTTKIMTPEELEDFKSGSSWRRYRNGEGARVLREFKIFEGEEFAIWFSPMAPGTLHKTPRAEWDVFVRETLK